MPTLSEDIKFLVKTYIAPYYVRQKHDPDAPYKTELQSISRAGAALRKDISFRTFNELEGCCDFSWILCNSANHRIASFSYFGYKHCCGGSIITYPILYDSFVPKTTDDVREERGKAMTRIIAHAVRTWGVSYATAMIPEYESDKQVVVKHWTQLTSFVNRNTDRDIGVYGLTVNNLKL